MLRWQTLGSLIALAALSVAAGHAQVSTTIYSGFNNGSGGGAPFSNPVGTLDTPGITFGADNGDNWHPFGLSGFGSDSTGFLQAAATGDYNFDLRSDDGSLLFVNGTQVIDNGNDHASNTVSASVHLIGGVATPFEVQFYENGAGPSSLDLTPAAGVSFVRPTTPTVPEPGSLALLAAALPLAGGLLRRRKTAR